MLVFSWIVTSSLLMKERNILKLRMAPGPSSIDTREEGSIPALGRFHLLGSD